MLAVAERFNDFACCCGALLAAYFQALGGAHCPAVAVYNLLFSRLHSKLELSMR